MDESISKNIVFSPAELPCGRIIKNRLVKVAMYEHLASFLGGPPNEFHYSLYSKWAKYGWGMIITGNVQVSNTHLSLGRDIVVPRDLSKASLRPFQKLAASIRGNGTTEVLAVMQLSHAGRQSANFIGGRWPFQRPLGPSPIGIKAKYRGLISDALHTFAFQTPKAMSLRDIDNAVENFVKGARLAVESGFDGIQLHAAHGYLLSQFISPLSNNRIDEYSTHQDNNLRFLHRVVSAVRMVVHNDFILGIKLNAADYASHGAEEHVLDHFRTIAKWGGVDFLEISGGSYEMPEFMGTLGHSPRQALFSRFSESAMSALESLDLKTCPLILLTGGLRTSEILNSVLTSRRAHLLGIGRGSILCPDLPCHLGRSDMDKKFPNRWSSTFGVEPNLIGYKWLHRFLPTIPLVGAGINMAWYIVGIRRLALASDSELSQAIEANNNLGPIGAVIWMWVDLERVTFWLAVILGAFGCAVCLLVS